METWPGIWVLAGMDTWSHFLLAGIGWVLVGMADICWVPAGMIT